MKRYFFLACAFLGPTLAVQADRSLSRQDYVEQVESCEAILREFQYHPATAIPVEVLREARTIVITNQFKVGFIFGVKDGYGVVLSKRADGTWSVPALIHAGETSVGLQLGANAIETVIIITDDSVTPLLYKNKFNIGIDAKAVSGPKVAEREIITRILKDAPVLVYAKKKGLFAGATVKAGWVSPDNKGNRYFYETNYSMPELLKGDWVPTQPEVEHLRQFVEQITR